MVPAKISHFSLLWPPAWSLGSFDRIDRMDAYYPHEHNTKYPVRYLRYWFVRHLLEEHARKLGRPIDVLEVGVDRGQMLTFMDALPGHRLPALVSRWDALDIAADAETLREKGYTDYVVCDLEKDEPIRLGHRYDAIIFLHLLEHLHIPERCLQSFLPLLTANGILTGGSPTMPKLIADMGYEKRLASAARPLGHVSILSPERIEQFAQVHGLKLSFLSGSHFTRSTGSWIENSALWLRLNMAFGWLFPSLGNEIYFSLSRQ